MNTYTQLDYRRIGERIKGLRGGESQGEFAKQFNLSQVDISRIERGEVRPSPELLYNICIKYGKPVDWLLIGERNKLSSPVRVVKWRGMDPDTGEALYMVEYDQSGPLPTIESDVEALLNVGKGEVDEWLKKHPNGRIGLNVKPSVPLMGTPIYNEDVVRVDIFSLAGAGHPKVLTEYEPIESIYLPRNFSGPSIVPVKVQGQSMYPTIWDGALVGIDREDRNIVSGELYAVWIPYEGAVVKRLFMEMDRVMVKSDNPIHPTLSILYKDLEMEGHGDNFILGRVKWVIQKQ